MWLEREKGSGDVQNLIYFLPKSENLNCLFMFYSLGYYVKNNFLKTVSLEKKQSTILTKTNLEYIVACKQKNIVS